ncbi:MAG: prolipoprotein diacylglyceryl transferase family protein, partial [Bacteroidota bacterium]
YAGGITILGALSFGPIGMLIGKRILRIKESLLDGLAIPILFSMAIQRMGCLFAGCCGGVMTNSDFGVSYAPFTTAHRFCAEHGTLDTLSSYTPALHPVPLYLLAVCVISSLIIYKTKLLFKAEGSRFIAAIVLFLLGRSIVEFWREPLTEGMVGDLVAGLKEVQWLLIGSSLVLLMVIYYREKHIRSKKVINTEVPFKRSKISLSNGLMVLLCFATIFISINSFYTPAELTAIILFSAISFCFYVVEYSKLYFPYYKFISNSIVTLLIVLFLPIMAQVSYDNSGDTAFTYNEISIGNQVGLFQHYHQEAIETGCNTYSYNSKYEHDIYASALGFARYYNYGFLNRFYFKINAAVALDHSNDPLEIDGKRSTYLMSVNPLLGLDTRYFGMNIQATFGNLHKQDVKTGEQPFSLTAGSPEFIFTIPSANFRFGSMKTFGVLLIGPNNFGLNTNLYPIMLGLGSGNGKNDGSYFRFNIGLAGSKLAAGMGLKSLFNNNAVELGGFAYNNGVYFGITYSALFGRKEVKVNRRENTDLQNRNYLFEKERKKQEDFVLFMDTSGQVNMKKQSEFAFKQDSLAEDNTRKQKEIALRKDSINKENTKILNLTPFEQDSVLQLTTADENNFTILQKERVIEVKKLNNSNKEVIKTIQKGKKVVITYIKSENLCTVRGKLIKINDSSIVVENNDPISIGTDNNITIPLESIKIISRKKSNDGVAIIFFGGVATAIGIIIGVSSIGSNDIGRGLAATIYGTIGIGGGGLLIIIGEVTNLLCWRTFDTAKGWSLSIKELKE